jgi:hypothetical protein
MVLSGMAIVVEHGITATAKLSASSISRTGQQYENGEQSMTASQGY